MHARRKRSFPSGANYTLRKQACSRLAGLARKNKMIPGNIKLSVSTVSPCKRPVSQLFRSIDQDINMSSPLPMMSCNYVEI